MKTSETNEDYGAVPKCAAPSPVDFRVGRGKFKYHMFLLNICMPSKARRGKVNNWNFNWVWVCSRMESAQILHLV